MGKQFTIKGLVESIEIQSSYDEGNYYDAVMKCRIYLEGWLSEYIYAILYPDNESATEVSRKLFKEKFNDMHIMINWLKRENHIDRAAYENLNNIRVFCDNVFRKNDVFKVVSPEKLVEYIELSIYYCAKIKESTRAIIEKAAMPGRLPD